MDIQVSFWLDDNEGWKSFYSDCAAIVHISILDRIDMIPWKYHLLHYQPPHLGISILSPDFHRHFGGSLHITDTGRDTLQIEHFVLYQLNEGIQEIN